MKPSLAPALAAAVRRHGVFLLAVGLLVAGTLASLGYLVWRLQQEAYHQARSTLQVHARNLEDQVTQSLQVIALTAANLDAAVASRDASTELNRHLTYTARPLPYVRSLSIVDAQGRVLASSNPANVGQQIDLQGFFPWVDGTSDTLRIGRASLGRDVGSPASAEESVGPSYIPVLRSIPSRGQPLSLLAALNSDYFLNASQQRLHDTQGHADWWRYDGLLLLSDDHSRALNAKDAQLRLEEHVQQAEHGVIERSLHAPNGQEVMSAYRSSSHFPIVVSVHTDRNVIAQQWVAESARIATVVLPILLALVGAGVVVQRRQEANRRQAQEIQQQQQLAASVFESSPDCIVITDAHANIISANAACLAVTGYRSDEVIGQNPRLFRSGLQSSEFYRDMWDSVLRTGHWRGTLVNRRKDGTPYTALLEISTVRGADGSVRYYTGLTQDITAQEAAQQRLQIAAGVFDHAAEGIMITDTRGIILDVNAAFSDITGYARDEVIGRSSGILSSGRQSPEFYAAMWQALESTGSWNGEVFNRRKDGEVYAEHLTISAVTDAQGQALRYVGLFSDITEKKEQERRLVQIAHYDALTGLPNRILLADRLRQAMAHSHRTGQPLAVLFLDLDGFKAVNDQYGHAAGDQLLIELSHRMRSALRENDTLSRLGGDEFVAVLAGVASAKACIPLLDRLIQCAAAPFGYQEHELRVSASVGVTVYPQDAAIDAEQLVRQADQAMYQAKVGGKNRYHFFDALHDDDVRIRHEQLQRIQTGLAAGEFTLLYQPKVNLRNGTLLGLEALLRWNHPLEGQLAPAAFLPTLQGHPLALELGRWVLHAALQQLAQWSRAGYRAEVSVNIDTLHLQSNHFAQELQALLAQHPEVEAAQLELELVETSTLDNTQQVFQAIAHCRALGVRFALDDFGTGHSSLSHLRQLPIQTIKLDQHFVAGLLDRPDDLPTLQAVIGLSLAFERQLIAEGVETSAHGTLLLQQGCEGAQGFAIAHPMPADAVWHWQQNWSANFRAP